MIINNTHEQRPWWCHVSRLFGIRNVFGILKHICSIPFNPQGILSLLSSKSYQSTFSKVQSSGVVCGGGSSLGYFADWGGMEVVPQSIKNVFWLTDWAPLVQWNPFRPKLLPTDILHHYPTCWPSAVPLQQDPIENHHLLSKCGQMVSGIQYVVFNQTPYDVTMIPWMCDAAARVSHLHLRPVCYLYVISYVLMLFGSSP